MRCWSYILQRVSDTPQAALQTGGEILHFLPICFPVSGGEALQASGELVEVAAAFGINEHAILLGPIGHERVERVAGMDVEFFCEAVNHLAGQAFHLRGDLAAKRIELLREPLSEFRLLSCEGLPSFRDDSGVFGG